MKIYLGKKEKNIILLTMSGVLSALPLTFPGLFFLSYISYVPFFLVLIGKSEEEDKLKYAFFRGSWYGFVYHLFIYYWFTAFYPMEYAGLSNAESVIFVIIIWLIVSLLHGLLWCIPTISCYCVSGIIKNRAFLVSLAILGIILGEKLTKLSQFSFPWVRVSLGQYRIPVLIQNAALFGIDGSDMLILGINGLIALAIVYPVKRKLVIALSVLMVFGLNFFYGIYRMNLKQEGESLNIMIVQGSVMPVERWTKEPNVGAQYSYNIYTSLTDEHISEKIDLVVWPESAIPTKLYPNSKYAIGIQNLSRDIATPLLTGAIWQVDEALANVTLYIEDNYISEPYIKRKLVPFGERLPYRNVLTYFFPVLDRVNFLEEDYVIGKEYGLTSTSKGVIANVICIEIIHPELVRESVLHGGQLIVVPTNDAWLKESIGVWQHLSHSVFRSIENSRYVVRAANSGVSVVVSQRGEIISMLLPMERGVIKDTVKFSDEVTLYTRIGDVLFPVCITLQLVWFFFLIKKKM